MSLDFDLYRKIERWACRCGHGYTAAPDDVIASFNITHNLNQMAMAAGIYGCLWRPEHQDPPIVTAGQCVPLLRNGLAAMKADPHRFKPLSMANGWGTYEQFVPWVEGVLAACEANPDTLVRALQ